MASKEIRVPDLGDFKDVAVVDVLVQPGQTVEVDTPLLTLETEKATMDVPSTEAGVIERLHVNKGARVSAGSLVATLRTGDAAGPEASAATPAASALPAARTDGGEAKPRPGAVGPSSARAGEVSKAPPSGASTMPAAARGDAQIPPTEATPPMPPRPGEPVDQAALPAELGVLGAGSHASPSVRKFARELGVDLGRVRGSGQKGRITADDVKAFVKARLSAPAASAPATGWPKVAVPDFAQFGPVEVKPLGRVQRISGPRVHASWVNLPHVTQFDEADITELEAVRTRLKTRAEAAGVKLTLLSFIVLACVRVLQKYPQFNSSLDESGENLVYKKYVHIGFAADTPQGLLVPVIRDANRKDIYETARTLGGLSERARAGKLAATEMQGGSFTISSLGGIGGTGFTPIINAPEVAILGVSRASMRAVFHEGGFVPRLILPLSLSYDHRVIDGAAGARFITKLGTILARPEGLLEAVP